MEINFLTPSPPSPLPPSSHFLPTQIMRNQGGASMGAGFVAFANPEEATRAVTELNGKMVGHKPLYVALAQRKEDRRQRLQVGVGVSVIVWILGFGF